VLGVGSYSALQVPVINSLRGLAASMVCFYHFVCTTINYVKDENVLSVFQYGQLGVQMFFVISGIVIPLSMITGSYNYPSWFRFISKRFIRIEPPYLVSIVIGIAYLYLRNFVPGSTNVDMTPSGRDIVLHLGYLIPFVENAHWVNPAYWTLAIEFQYYLLLSVLFPLVLKGKWLGRFFFYSLMIIPSLLIPGHSMLPYWIPVFLTGILFALRITCIIDVKEYIGGTLVCIVLIYLRIGIADAAITVITLLIINLFGKFTFRIGEFVGRISYSLYLLHSIIGSAVINFLSHRFTVPWQKVAVICIGYAISVFSAWLMYLLIERPSQNLSRKIKY
jgi:peptidoglycan/LPS O-acetylase OafA/YrhL